MRLPWYTSWLFIILFSAASIEVPALGLISLVLLSIRVHKDRKINYTAGRTIRGLGNWIMVSGIALVIYGAGEEVEEAVISGVVLFVVALIIRSIGKHSIAKSQMYGIYMDAIYNRQVRSVHQVAGMLNKTPNVVQHDLQSMINKGHMPGATFQNSIISVPIDSRPAGVNIPVTTATSLDNPPQGQPQSVQPRTQQQSTQPQPVQPVVQQVIVPEPPKPRPPKVVVCRGCGSSTTIEDGQVVECEFCGSHITYDM